MRLCVECKKDSGCQDSVLSLRMIMDIKIV